MMPLIFEKLIPYQIKTIAVTSTFYAFSDLAMATFTSCKVKVSPFVLAYASLMASAAVLSTNDIKTGYGFTLGLLGMHVVPTILFAMPNWVRAWRLLFYTSASVSIVTAWRRIEYYENNWDKVVFSNN